MYQNTVSTVSVDGNDIPKIHLGRQEKINLARHNSIDSCARYWKEFVVNLMIRGDETKLLMRLKLQYTIIVYDSIKKYPR